MSDTGEIFRDALRLPADARLELASLLVSSVRTEGLSSGPSAAQIGFEVEGGSRPDFGSLLRFLVDRFNGEELKGLMMRLEQGTAMLNSMSAPNMVSHNAFCTQAVETLYRHGALSRGQFFALLSEARPLHCDEISQLEALWSSCGGPEAPDEALDQLVLAFLEEWSRYGFNAQRIVGWGGDLMGFEELSGQDTWAVFEALERLHQQGRVRTFRSRKTGSTLYTFAG